MYRVHADTIFYPVLENLSKFKNNKDMENV